VDIELAEVDWGLELVLAPTQRVPLVDEETGKTPGRRPGVSGRDEIYFKQEDQVWLGVV
jgi:hypothetical protein